VNGKYQSTEQRRTQKGKAHITEEAGAEEAKGLSTRQQEAKSEEVGERTGEAVVRELQDASFASCSCPLGSC